MLGRKLVPESKKNILCVEDHEDSCRLVADFLKDYEVVGAYSMADALKKALRGRSPRTRRRTIRWFQKRSGPLL
jgi:response regulator RpfG family c-di-GMP phosphodiesterase